MLDRSLRTVGLSIADVNLKTMTFADVLSAFPNKSIDLAVEIEPFVAPGEANGLLLAWKRSEEMYPNQQEEC